jgi:hypothetical protein
MIPYTDKVETKIVERNNLTSILNHTAYKKAQEADAYIG